MKLADDLRLCRVCKEPTYVRTVRGAPVHLSCEGWAESLTEDAYETVIWEVAQAMGGAEIEYDLPPDPPGGNPLPASRYPPAPCSWCGKPGVSLLDPAYPDDTSVHCPDHLWPPFRWPPPPEREQT